ncbi:MAG: ATP-binding protein [Negativicutes bacterium]
MMKVELIQVDREKCVKCGICADVCPIGIIHMKQEWPEQADPESCIACGHCTAACPHEAIDNLRAPLSGQTVIAKFPVVPQEQAYQFSAIQEVYSQLRKKTGTQGKTAAVAGYCQIRANGQQFPEHILCGH